MKIKSIFYYLGLSIFPITFLAFFSLIYSSYFQFFIHFEDYIITLFVTGSLASLLYYSFKNENKELDFYEQLVLIFLIYLLVPLLLALPYYLSNYNFSIINSYFESISGFTGTGFSLIANVKNFDPILLIWRSSTQWLGGLYFICAVIIIFSNFKLDYKLTNIIYNPDRSSQINKNFNPVFFKILSIYLFLSVLIFLILNISGLRVFDAFNLAMTLISAGGFLPTDNLGSIIKSPVQQIALIICFALVIKNIYFLYGLTIKKEKLKNFYEDILIAITVLFFVVILLFFYQNAGILNIIEAVLSSISNIGLSTNPTFDELYLYFLFLTLIGGSILSSSSGLKVLRFYILLKATFIEIFRLVKPNNIINLNIFISEKKINNDLIKNSFLVFILFFFSLFILSSLLVATGNLAFEDSFKLSILTITNTVNSNLYGLDQINFFNFNEITKFSLIIFMIIGKIELISFLVILRKFFKS